MWLFFLGLNLVGLSGYNLILRKVLLNKLDRWTLATLMQTSFTVPLLFVLPFYHPSLAVYKFKDLEFIAVIALLTIALHITNVKSLQYLEASVYSVLYNLRIVLTTILGILFLRESIIPLQIAGGLIIFLAIITVKQKGQQTLTRRGLEWGVSAAVVISVLNFFEKEFISRVGYIAYAAPVWIIAALIMWTVLLLRKQKFDLAIFKDPRIYWLMLFRAMSAYGFGLSFDTGAKLSVATYISSLSVIVMVVLGIVLLNERDYLKQKVVAVAMAVIGLTCILIASLI